MMRITARMLAACAIVLTAEPAAPAEMIRCKLTYSLTGWSFFYKTSKGGGRVSCSNGQSAAVEIVTYGGGITFGTSEVIDGKGVFSAVRDISDVFGSYAEADAHAGAGQAADARFMAKGNVNLSLLGPGQGISAGFAFGSFHIAPK